MQIHKGFGHGDVHSIQKKENRATGKTILCLPVRARILTRTGKRIFSMATSSKVLLNTGFQILGKIGSIAASLVVVKIISGYGQAFYGNYLTSYEFLAFFGVLADAGLFAVAVREMSRTPKRTADILGNILGMRLLLVFMAVILAGGIAWVIPGYDSEVKLGIWLTGISMALTIVAGTLSSVLQSRMKIYAFSGPLFAGKVLLALGVFLLAWYSGLEGTELFYAFLGAGIFSNTVFCALVYFFVSREVPIRIKVDLPYWRITLRESLPYGMALILQTLYLRADLVLISLILGAGAVGVYGVGARILESFLVVGVFFGQAILPKIASEEADTKRTERTLAWGIEKMVLIALPCIIGGLFFAPEIIRIISSDAFISTPEFFGSDKVFALLLPAVLFAYLNQLFTFTLVAKGLQMYLLRVNALAFLLNAGLNIALLPHYGIGAAALTTIISEVLVFMLLFGRIRQHFCIPFLWGNWLRVLCICIIIWAELALTPVGGSLILSLAVCGITYVFFLWWWRRQLLFPSDMDVSSNIGGTQKK